MEQLFFALKDNRTRMAATDAQERCQKLEKLYSSILNHREDIREALYLDFKRHPSEVDLSEIYPLLSEIRQAKANLKKWMKPQYVKTPLAMLGAKSKILWQPKGVVLIISPWNFPFTLSLGPLISAIAAGNTVAIKPSEFTPNSLKVISTIVKETFATNEVAVFEGDAQIANQLLELPFQHIFFTGSPRVGKIVMQKAATHLASVTLELGGKSPTIIDESADLASAIPKIAWAKWLNNGQLCIAPDYLWVHHSRLEEITARLKEQLEKFYGPNPKESASYGRLISKTRFDKLASLLDAQGAKVSGLDRQELYLAPTILSDVKWQDPIMQEEIFGPILPILTYQSIEEVISKLKEQDKPLALYLYSKNEEVIDKILAQTSSGTACINHSGLQFLNLNLPFGGDNFSGIGKSHGVYGFQAFSNAKAVLEQKASFSPIELMMPPYNKFKQKLIDFTLRWF